jgi:hypothetical protein
MPQEPTDDPAEPSLNRTRELDGVAFPERELQAALLPERSLISIPFLGIRGQQVLKVLVVCREEDIRLPS